MPGIKSVPPRCPCASESPGNLIKRQVLSQGWGVHTANRSCWDGWSTDTLSRARAQALTCRKLQAQGPTWRWCGLNTRLSGSPSAHCCVQSWSLRCSGTSDPPTSWIQCSLKNWYFDKHPEYQALGSPNTGDPPKLSCCDLGPPCVRDAS